MFIVVYIASHVYCSVYSSLVHLKRSVRWCSNCSWNYCILSL